MIVLLNLFGPRELPRMLFVKLRSHFHVVAPFLILLNIFPEVIRNVGRDGVDYRTSQVVLDQRVVSALRRI